MCCLQNDRTPTYKILDVITQKSCQITKQGSKSDRESKKEQRGHERPIRKIQKGQDQIQEALSTSEEKI